jgi:hypothetical protein
MPPQAIYAMIGAARRGYRVKIVLIAIWPNQVNDLSGARIAWE